MKYSKEFCQDYLNWFKSTSYTIHEQFPRAPKFEYISIRQSPPNYFTILHYFYNDKAPRDNIL